MKQRFIRANLSIVAIIILIAVSSILGYLIYIMNRTERSLAKSLLEKPMQGAEISLHSFFNPVKNALLSIKQQGQLGMFDSINSDLMNSYFTSITDNFPQISSVGIANTEGYEYDVIPTENGYDNRVIWVDKWGTVEKWSSWKINYASGNCSQTKQWTGTIKHDPRIRPWFQGAVKTSGNSINWTQPYVYNTNNQVGMTASLCWTRPNDIRKHIMALDLTLADISEFTQNLSVSPNGKTFVLTQKGNYIGLPKDTLFDKNKNLINKNLLSHVSSLNIPPVSKAYFAWKSKHREQSTPFKYTSNGEQWWAKLIHYDLSNNRPLIVGVIIPEKDILTEMKRTKHVTIGGFLLVLILMGFVFYFYRESKLINTSLALTNEKVNKQRVLIQEKSKEIIDSINYAKRIQTAILPPDKEIKACLPDSFVFYKPKDIVAGDFYWLEHKDHVVFFAVADCTGHGVPGALVSVVCKNGLSQSLRDHTHELEPGRILNKTRELVVKQFEKSEEEVKDGMDIALCSLNGDVLKYAGAHRPLWIIRNGSHEIEELKPDKQPIGKFETKKSFSTRTTKLNKGDTIYLFSDGYADQFGGEKGKKYMAAKFRQLLLSIQRESMNKQKELLETAFEKWKGHHEQLDDVCVIGVRV